MKKLLFLIVLIAAAIAAYIHVPKHAAGIEDDIQTRLSRVMLEKNIPTSITMNVDGRDVVLEGVSETDRLKNQANELAANLTGVRTVTNNIKVPAADLVATYEPEFEIETSPTEDMTETDSEVNSENVAEVDAQIKTDANETASIMDFSINQAETQDTAVQDTAIEVSEVEDTPELVEEPAMEIATPDLEMPPPPSTEESVTQAVKIEPAPAQEMLKAVEENASSTTSSMTSACQDKLANMMANEKINFDSGRSSIKSGSYGLLNRLTTAAKKCDDVVVHIHGHTDNTGDANVNQKISLNRAKSVGRYMISKGVRHKIRVVGHGSAQPVASNDTDAGKAQNRRIEFKITKAQN